MADEYVSKNTDMEGPTQVQEKLKQAVEGLLSSAYQLRESLVARDLDSIWANLAQQEKQAGQLEEYSQLWGELKDVAPAENAEDCDLRNKIRDDLGRVRAVQRSNFILARSLLSAVEKAMTEGTESNVGRANAYNTRGKKKRKGERFFVRQQG